MKYDTATQDICGVRQALAQREARLKSYLSFFNSYENEMRNYGRAWSKWHIVGLLLSCIILIIFTPTIRNGFYRVNRFLGPSHYPSFSDLIFITNTLISSIPFLFMAFVCAEIMYRRRLDHVFDIQSQQKSRIESFLGRLQVLQQNLDEAVVEIKNASKDQRLPSIPSGIDNAMNEFARITEEYKFPHSKYKKKYIRIFVSSVLAFSLVLLTTLPALKGILRLSAASDSPLYVRNIAIYVSEALLNHDASGSLFVSVSALYSLIYMGIATIIALCGKTTTGGVFYVVACVAGHAVVLVLIALVLDLPIIVHLLIIFFFIWRCRTHS